MRRFVLVAVLLCTACSGEAAGRAVRSDGLASSATPGNSGASTLPAAEPLSPDSVSTSSAPVVTTASPLPSILVPPNPPGVVVSRNGVVLPVLEHRRDGRLVRTPCDRRIVVNEGTFIERVDVVVDPGHGGRATGAVGPGGLAEADANLAVAKLVVAKLEAAGLAALLTRTADYEVSLGSRAQTARSAGASAFVSIHFNADPDGPTPGPGSETYFQAQSPGSRRLAGLVYEEVHATLSGFSAEWAGDTDAGTKYRLNADGDDYYGILRHPAGVTAALIESAFISNPSEERLIGDPAFQTALADAITRAVVRFHRTDDSGSGFIEPYARETDVGGDGTTGPQCVEPPL